MCGIKGILQQLVHTQDPPPLHSIHQSYCYIYSYIGGRVDERCLVKNTVKFTWTIKIICGKKDNKACLIDKKFFVLFWSDGFVFRVYSRLCIQGTLLVWLGGPYVMPGIEAKLAVCKANTTFIVLSLYLSLWPKLIIYINLPVKL